MDFLEPPPVGDPAAMHAYASALARRAEHLFHHAESIKARALSATFRGPAGDRFREFISEQHRSLLATSADLNELAGRVRAQANEVAAAIAAWERYRDAMLEARIDAARTGAGTR